MANSASNIDNIIQSQASKEVTANAFFDAASHAATYGRRASTSSGLTWGYYGGNVVLSDETMSQIANGTLTLTASTTNYIVAAKSTGAVSVSTSTANWNNQSSYHRLYQVVTGASTVTSWTDARRMADFQGSGGGGGGGGGSGFAPVVSSASTSISLTIAESGAYLRTTSGSAVTVTIPAQASQPWESDVEIHIEQAGAGAVTIAGAGGVTVNRMSAVDPVIAGQYGVVTIKRVAENVWTLFGALAEA